MVKVRRGRLALLRLSCFCNSNGLLSPDGPSETPGCVKVLMHPEEEP